MRILMLTPYLPYPLLSGGQIRTYNLLKQLAGSHQVTLFALIKNDAEKEHIQALQPYCEEIQLFKRSQHPFTFKNILKTGLSRYPFLVIRNHVSAMTPVIDEYLSQKKFDLIHAETFYMMPHLPPTNVPVLLVEQTIEYLGYESYAQKSPAWMRPLLKIDIDKIKTWEFHYWESCHKLVVMSENDRQLVTKHVSQPDKIEVVANGVDTNWFAQKEARSTKNPTVLFVGTFKWLPNREAVTYLLTQVWPKILEQLPSAQLKVVGNAPTKELLELAHKTPQVHVEGKVPDIRDAFTAAQVLIAPVFSGKGTRYKVLEALAAGTAVVATPTAVEGLGVQPNFQVVIGQTAQELADQTVKLLTKPEQRRRLIERGRQFVQTYYDWSLISKRLDQIYKSMGNPDEEKNQ